ncbi:hypothetical protein EYZ11_013401 [Aspergillus tanneri]|uniref:Carboxylesterase type B domain-containing protein n=1 Tax=Aspergillus tanneri TaxID=1220188 RepID=A0A4S3IYA2_9EURO|nr:hypothetical protein EYZ11_013401 [Aspergillus tanneri]
MSCLRLLDIATIQTANVATPFPGGSSDLPPLWYFLPVIDVGDDTDEGSIFAYNGSRRHDLSRFFKANYPNLHFNSLEKIHRAYPCTSQLPKHGEYFSSISAAYGDATFTCPGIKIASSMADHFLPNNIWNYRYNVQAPRLISEGLGVPHIFELSAIFGVGFAGSSESSSYGSLNAAIVPVVMHYWISFVKILNPNHFKYHEAPYWEPWGSGDGRRLRLQTNSTEMELIPQGLSQNCSMWRTLSKEMDV